MFAIIFASHRVRDHVIINRLTSMSSSMLKLLCRFMSWRTSWRWVPGGTIFVVYHIFYICYIYHIFYILYFVYRAYHKDDCLCELVYQGEFLLEHLTVENYILWWDRT